MKDILTYQCPQSLLEIDVKSLKANSGKYKGRRNSDTTKVPLHDRVKQFPEESLVVKEGKMFCNGRREIVSSKISILEVYASFKKHQKSKDRLKNFKLKDETILESFRRENTSKNSTFPVEECAYSLEVIIGFLKAGIPIAKIDMCQPLLEKNSPHLGQYASIALKKEIENIKKELRTGP